MTSEETRELQEKIRTLMSCYYDMQGMRIRINNRIAGYQYRKRMIALGNVDEHGNVIAKKEERDSKAHERMIQALIDFYLENEEEVNAKKTAPAKEKYLQKKGGIIDNIVIWSNIADLIHYKDREDYYYNSISNAVKQHPVYVEFLSKVPYCGISISSVILSTLDIHKARHVSSFWKYCGTDPVVDPDTGKWVGRGLRKSTMEDVEYIDSNGELKTKKSIGYNPRLRSKLLGVLAEAFIKYNVYYRCFYDAAKYRYTKRAEINGENLSKDHIHRMAIRKMINMFLKDLWVYWRRLEGYPVEPDYFEAYVAGRPHGKNYKQGDAGPNPEYYPGMPYDPNREGLSETEKMAIARWMDMKAITPEQAEKETNMSADELEKSNYDKVPDIYNRPKEHKKLDKEAVQQFLDFKYE